MSLVVTIVHSRTMVVLYMGLLLPCFLGGIAYSQDDTVQRLASAVMGGPALYRTPEAIEYYSQRGLTKGLAEQQQNRDDAVRSLRSVIKLGEMGTRAKAAIPVLIDMFPQLEHVVAKRGVHYTTGNGSLEDWVQTFLISEKSNFVFSSPFVEFETMSKCESFIEAAPFTKMLFQKMGAGGRVVEAVADIFIVLRVNAAACALSRITGKEFGADREAWRRWWSQESGSASAVQASASFTPRQKKSFADINAGATYKLHLVTGDDLTGVVTSKNDTSLTLKTAAGSPYSIGAVLVDKYEALAAPQQAASGAVQADQGAPTAPTQNRELTFEDLAQGGLSGKTMEIQIRNGSVFRGVFTGVNGDQARISIEGAEIPLSRLVITKIMLIQK